MSGDLDPARLVLSEPEPELTLISSCSMARPVGTGRLEHVPRSSFFFPSVTCLSLTHLVLMFHMTIDSGCNVRLFHPHTRVLPTNEALCMVNCLLVLYSTWVQVPWVCYVCSRVSSSLFPSPLTNKVPFRWLQVSI